MKSIKSKVIATLFALCFALLGYSCQCEAQEKYEVISITVETKEDKGYESDKTYALVGGQLALKAIVETEPSGKAEKVNWSSNNENVTVDKNGLVTIKEGATAESVEITATSAMDETKSDSITLTLYSIDITIISAKDSVSINKTLQLTANIDSTPSDIPEVLKKVSWSSSNEAIATVSDTGLVTAKETEGSVTITATLPGGKTETKTLEVVLPAPGLENAIVLYSSGPFSLRTSNNQRNWKKADNTTGLIQWSNTNSGTSTWNTWDGREISAAKGGNNPDPEKYYIYLRGKGNAIITGDNTEARFVITGTGENADENAKVTLDRNIMNLLDYEKDYTDPANLIIPADYCFANLSQVNY